MRPAIPLLCLSLSVFAASPTIEIKVDQAGYLSTAPKLAMVASKSPASEFIVHSSKDDAVVLRGKLSEPAEDADSGDRVQAADFSKLSKAGAYYIEVPGVGRSWEFRIGRDVYARTLYLAMRSFYGQRCGTAVDLGSEFPGYKYAACHLEGAYHATSGKSGARKPSKGWHDAGDYGRYVVNSGITTGTLLWSWEMFSKQLQKLKLNIPESGGKTPDILGEIRWNLEWMLSMQDEDGGVWHKQTSEQFCPFVMPDKDTSTSYVIGTGAAPYKSSCATADFAAVMAIAGRTYKAFDAKFAETCLRAARQAWTWLDKNPNVLFRNPKGVQTGEYGDRNCSDEILWASAELWRTTREAAYERYFLDHYAEFRATLRTAVPENWNQLAPMALWTYVLGQGKDSTAVAAIREDSLKAADEIVTRAAQNGYRTSMTAKDYVWGSNGVLANYGMQLLVAYAIDSQPRYVHAALEDLHYLLGRNTFSLSFVTQVGANPFRHPHHRPSGADNNPEPWPGLLSGGPNRGKQDAVLQKLPNVPPAKAYVDDQNSYAGNENAINWNAPLVFLLAGALAMD